nr:hypothetical protein [Pseudooceanicola sp. HF7]
MAILVNAGFGQKASINTTGGERTFAASSINFRHADNAESRTCTLEGCILERALPSLVEGPLDRYKSRGERSGIRVGRIEDLTIDVCVSARSCSGIKISSNSATLTRASGATKQSSPVTLSQAVKRGSFRISCSTICICRERGLMRTMASIV